MKRAYKEAKQRELQFVMEYIEYSPEYAVFMISDPDGNVIELAGTP